MTTSLAFLEEGTGSPGPPLLLALGGDVNIMDCDHNLLVDGIMLDCRPAGSVFWSKSMPPAAKFRHKHSCSSPTPPTTAGQQQLVSNSCVAPHRKHTQRNFHVRSGDNDVIITMGSQWQHIQEDLRLCNKPVKGSDAPNPIAARRLLAMSEQPAASKLSSSSWRHVLQHHTAKSPRQAPTATYFAETRSG